MLRWFRKLKEEQEPPPHWYRRGVRGIILVLVLFAVLGLILISLYAVEMTTVVSGVIRPVRTFKVKPTISGIVKEVKVSTGERVKAGQLVALLDDTEIRGEIRKTEKALESLDLNLRRLSEELEFEQAKIASEIEAAKADLEIANAELKKAMSRYSLSRKSYADIVGEGDNSVVEPFDVKMKEALVRRAEAVLQAKTTGLKQLDILRSRIDGMMAEKEKLLEELQGRTKVFEEVADKVRNPGEGRSIQGREGLKR